MSESDRPDWKFWNACTTLRVWEAVALSLNRGSHSVKRDNGWRTHREYGIEFRTTVPVYLPFIDETAEFQARLAIVLRALDHRNPPFIVEKSSGDRWDWVISAASIRTFLVAQGLSIPNEWHSPTSHTVTETRQLPTWRQRSLELNAELKREHPVWGTEKLAKAIAARLAEENYKSRTGEIIRWDNVIRHGMRPPKH